MSNKPITPNLQHPDHQHPGQADGPPTLSQLVARIKASVAAIAETSAKAEANKLAYARAAGENLALAHVQHIQERDWCRFLRDIVGIGRTTAFDYELLDKNRTQVDAFVRSSEQTGKTPSIAGALRAIRGPKPPKPPQPKTFSEIDDPVAFAAFLERRPDLLFEALPFAPTVRVKIAKASATGIDSATTAHANTTENDLVREVRALLAHPTPPNVEGAREKLARLVRLTNPPAKATHPKTQPSKAALDPGLLPRALRLKAA
jgi:hypothetical protein